MLGLYLNETILFMWQDIIHNIKNLKFMKLFKEVSVNKLSHSRNISKGLLLLCAESVPNFNGVMNYYKLCERSCKFIGNKILTAQKSYLSCT